MGALVGDAGGGDGTVEDPLHAGALDALHGPDLVELAVGDAQGDGVDRVDIAAGDGQLGADGLAQDLHQGILAGLHGLGFGSGGGQILAHLTAQGAASGGDEAADQGLLLQLHEDGDQLIVGVKLMALLLGQLQAVHPGYTGQLLDRRDGLHRLLPSCRSGQQTEDHAQAQQHRCDSFHRIILYFFDRFGQRWAHYATVWEELSTSGDTKRVLQNAAYQAHDTGIRGTGGGDGVRWLP